MGKLKLNESKTKIMELNSDSNITFKVNMIDERLKFKNHIDYICKKISKKISYFKRITNQVSILTAVNIYDRMIQRHFEYGSTILFRCCTTY